MSMESESVMSKNLSEKLSPSKEVAPGVVCVPILFVNVYFLVDGDDWIVVDTGLPKFAWRVREAAAQHFGKESRPKAIVLTHGHFDHAGNAAELAQEWDVPIFVHELELPFVSGASDYPPQDPTVGGAIAMMSRGMTNKGFDFGNRVEGLPKDGSVPGIEGWSWRHTSGHSPGHISLWHDSQKILVAGDALATMDLDSWSAQVTRQPKISNPPAPFTPDWASARLSVESLADLEPDYLVAGHGQAMQGEALAEELSRFAKSFKAPDSGRYVGEPAKADREGLRSLPAPVDDPFSTRLLGAGVLTVVALAYFWWRRS